MAVSEAAKPVSLGRDDTKPRTPLADTWAQFKRNRAAVLSLIFIVGLIFVALTADLWRQLGFINGPTVQHRGEERAAPMTCATDNAPGEPEFCFIAGADQLGRDIMSRVVFGTRISLAVGAVGTVISLSVGVIYGMIAGYYGGRLDNLMMRIVDYLYGLPDLVLIILMQVFFKALADYSRSPNYQNAVGPLGVALVDLDRQMGGLLFLFIAMSFLAWIGEARLTRGQILSLKEKEFIEAARSIGANNRRIIFVHLLPNIIGPLIVVGALSVPGYIFTEATLSVLGLGINPPIPSWGSMISDAYKEGFQSLPNLILAPGLALAFTVLAFIFLGDGLRDALDPRLRGK